jgi:hypothetical protein
MIYDGADQTMSEDLYSGVSTFGVIMSDIKAVVGIIVAIILISLGIYFVRSKSHRTSTVDAVLSNTNCVNSNNGSTMSNFDCSFDATYTIDGKEFKKHFNTPQSNYKGNNDTITLYYDPSDNNDISPSSDNLHFIGWFLIVFAVIIAISSILWAFLANKYKPVAAASGVLSGINMITGRGF